jgi:hypothetical protein
MNTLQEQIKISVSPELKSLIRTKAEEIGVPVTQYVKNLIINDVKGYPTFQASEETEKRAQRAMKELPHLKPVKNLTEYLKDL